VALSVSLLFWRCDIFRDAFQKYDILRRFSRLGSPDPARVVAGVSSLPQRSERTLPIAAPRIASNRPLCDSISLDLAGYFLPCGNNKEETTMKKEAGNNCPPCLPITSDREARMNDPSNYRSDNQVELISPPIWQMDLS